MTRRKEAELEGGVSETIGSVLLISLVVLGVAIVAVLLLSQSTPQKIPNVNFMTGTLTQDGTTKMYLYHNGGDTLAKGTFSVLVDDKVRNDYIISDGSTEWSLGQNLILTVPSGRHSVALIYNATGSPVVLRSGTSSDISVVGTPRPDVRISTGYPPVVSVPQLMQNVTNNSVNYYRAGGTKMSEGYIQFNVTKRNSTIFYQPTAAAAPVMVQLDIGNVVKITPYTGNYPQNFRMFGIGDQIWEFTANNATLVISNRSTSDLSPGIVPITHLWITGYKDFRSTLAIKTQASPGTYFTEIAINKYESDAKSQTFSSQVVNCTTASYATIDDVSPARTGMITLIFDNQTQSTFFAGNGSYAITGSLLCV